MSLRFVAITPGDDRDLPMWLRGIARHVDAVVLREPGRSALSLSVAVDEVRRAGALAIVHSRSASIRADGVHVRDGETVPEGALVGASCHDPLGLDAAFSAGATYAFLSPVWAPSSKPLLYDALGIERFVAWSAGRPVLALGGVTSERAGVLARRGYGCAVLGGLFGESSPLAAATAAARYRASVDAGFAEWSDRTC